jgi:hypothetical protein
MKIQPIVEGHGECEAVPVLLRRLIVEAAVYELGIGRPIRQSRSHLLNEDRLRKAVRLALKQPDCRAILVLFDADRDCPKELAPKIEGWAREEAGQVPCAVVMASREYEAWFLASIESLRGKHGIRKDAESHPSPEKPRGAKGLLEKRMVANQSYVEKIDQPALTRAFDLAAAYAKCRSFRKLVGAFGTLAKSAGAALKAWPPRTWAASGR